MPSIGQKLTPKVLKTEKRTDGQWVYIRSYNETIEMGPYASAKELQEDTRGVVDFLLHSDEPGYVTSERNPKPRTPKPQPYVAPKPIIMAELGEEIEEED